MSAHLDYSIIEAQKADFESNQNAKLMQSIIATNDMAKLITNRDNTQVMSHKFTHQLDPKISITDQKRSGRCWLFAALNILRRSIIQKYDLTKDFELSQNYLLFWDKYERMNYNLELIINTHTEPLDSREVQQILDQPCEDGGQWDMFVNLIRKYGIVPKHTYQESHHSSNTGDMRNILKKKFKDMAHDLRTRLAQNQPLEQVRQVKQTYLDWVFQTLCKFLGTPPTEATQFTWEYYHKKEKYAKIDNLTPLKFYHECINLDLDLFTCLVHDPRNEYYKKYTVKNLGNILDGSAVQYINIPIDQMKRLAYQSLANNQAVWFGCDFGKHRAHCELDLKITHADKLFDTQFNLTKEQRLRYGDSLMTHAMVFTGCNLLDSKQELINRWQVENSHGKSEPADGMLVMSDEWFSEYVYEIAVMKKFLTLEMLEAIKQTSLTILPPWDPMGALAE